MQHTEFSWASQDGAKVYAQKWLPQGEVKATVNLVHGMGEHSSRYEHVADFLANKGYAVYTFDQLGHGRTTGKKGHTPSYEALLANIDVLLNKSKEDFPDLSQILYGHSMGGNLVLNYGLRRKPKIKGVISTSPWLRLAFEPPAIQLTVGKFVRNLMPAFVQSTKLNTKHISRDLQEVKKYEQDPLNHDKISTTFFFGVHEAGLWALEHAAEWSLPLFLSHGTADQITSFKASEEFSANAKNTNFKSWPDMYHETHNEIGKQQVLQTMSEWIDKVLVGDGLLKQIHS
jgi:alpha-beta hydrolase superfamily lysophospholipase